MRTILFLAMCASAAALPAAGPEQLEHDLGKGASVRLIAEPMPHFSFTGLAREIAASADKHFAFSVFREGQPGGESPPLLGKFSAQDDALEFHPRFKLSHAVKIQLRVESQLADKLGLARHDLLFQLPAPPPRPPVVVEAVYPSSDELPENVLKFYIHFSAPMSRGEAYERVHLYQGDQVVEGPFLELGEELWDPGQTRFTLFLHPGRIKRGLKPREVEGPPMAVGGHYVLRIDDQWTSADGQKLAKSYEKKFTVIEADQQQLDPRTWKIETPAVKSQNPVALVFDEPLDHAMLSRVLSVQHRDGTPIAGEISISEHETRWSYTPSEPWRIGTYDIFIATNLEDRCGNSIARPFETKMQQRAASQPSTRIAVEFIVK